MAATLWAANRGAFVGLVALNQSNDHHEIDFVPAQWASQLCSLFEFCHTDYNKI
jgi:hypothetical protein